MKIACESIAVKRAVALKPDCYYISFKKRTFAFSQLIRKSGCRHLCRCGRCCCGGGCRWRHRRSRYIWNNTHDDKYVWGGEKEKKMWTPIKNALHQNTNKKYQHFNLSRKLINIHLKNQCAHKISVCRVALLFKQKVQKVIFFRVFRAY